MRITLKWGALLVPLVFTPGCFFALPAGMNEMTVATPQAAGQCATTPLRNNISVKDVSGGKTTYFFRRSEIGNNQFRGALENSLIQAGLLEKHVGEGRYLMSARIIVVEREHVGFLGGGAKVKTSVRYEVIDRTSEDKIFCESISAEYTATTLDNPIGVWRLEVASEGSARENIRKMIEKLLNLNVSTGTVTVQ